MMLMTMVSKWSASLPRHRSAHFRVAAAVAQSLQVCPARHRCDVRVRLQ
jgi:hypothetical protein